MELAKANQRIDDLINKLTDKPVESIPVNESVERKPIQTRQIPWTVRKQMLETESREKAAAMRNAVVPDKIKELELEIGIENGPKAVNS